MVSQTIMGVAISVASGPNSAFGASAQVSAGTANVVGSNFTTSGFQSNTAGGAQSGYNNNLVVPSNIGDPILSHLGDDGGGNSKYTVAHKNTSYVSMLLSSQDNQIAY